MAYTEERAALQRLTNVALERGDADAHAALTAATDRLDLWVAQALDAGEEPPPPGVSFTLPHDAGLADGVAAMFKDTADGHYALVQLTRADRRDGDLTVRTLDQLDDQLNMLSTHPEIGTMRVLVAFDVVPQVGPTPLRRPAQPEQPAPPKPTLFATNGRRLT